MATFTQLDPSSMTACRGFTALDIAAHLAASAAQKRALLEAVLKASPMPSTQSFGNREAPFRALAPSVLLDRMQEEFTAMADHCDDAMAAGDPFVELGGASMPVSMLISHTRNELAIHRWDLCGAEAEEELAEPAITLHAALMGHLLLGGWPRVWSQLGTRFRAALRSPGTDDVVVTIDATGGRLSLERDSGLPGLNSDAAARLLLMWGRQPVPASRVLADLDSMTGCSSRAR